MRLAHEWLSALATGECNLLDDDLAEYSQDHGSPVSFPSYKTYIVRSRVLSDYDILPEDVLSLRLLAEGERPSEVSIVAVHLELALHRILLLRLFVPPRQLTVNTDSPHFPPLVLGQFVRLIAAAPCGVQLSPWPLPVS